MIGFGQGRERAERLVTLACVLQLGRPLTLGDLRDRFHLYTDGTLDTSRRRFERDKQDLRQLGIEVVTRSLGGDEAYSIRTQLPAVAIAWTEDELLALATLSAAVADQTTGAALAKVSFHRDVMPDEHAAARIRIDLGEVPAGLTEAHAHHRRVRFTYRNARGEVAERTVEPWAIASRRLQTYVTGWDLAREEGRAFRVDRIVGEVADDGQATHPRPERGQGVPLAPEDRSDVRLRIRAHRLRDALAMGATVVRTADDAGTDHDGTMEVELAGVRDETAVGWALRHQADVVAPAAIADTVAGRRARLRDRHTGDPSLPPLSGEVPTKRPRRAGLTDQRLARLLALPEWLVTRPGVTIEEIATAFGCEVGEVRAELDLLDMLEVPQLGFVGDVTEHADGQLEFHARLGAPRADLTAVEAVSLLSLVEAARVLLPTDAVPALDAVAAKLRAHLGDAAASLALVELDTPALTTLRDVAGTDAVVAFAYRGRHDDEVEHRRVQPLQLQLLGGAVYLSAYDLDRRDVRSFRIDRLHDVSVEAPATTPVAPADHEPDYVPVTEEHAVELRLTTRATWILRLLVPTRVEQLGGGEVHALVHTDAPDWLLAHVRAAGGQAELLRPAELRGALA